jgi:hypothetical protein
VPESPIEFEHFSVMAPEEWDDITEDLIEGPDDQPPYSLARADGDGVLQFSLALYRAGKEPNPTVQDLANMLVEATEKYGVGAEHVVHTPNERLLIVRTDFVFEDSSVRMWHVSDRVNFAKVTYVAQEQADPEELNEAETIVLSTTFRCAPAA